MARGRRTEGFVRAGRNECRIGINPNRKEKIIMTKFSQLFRVFLLERYPDRALNEVEEDQEALIDPQMDEFTAWCYESGRAKELEEADQEMQGRISILEWEKILAELAARGEVVSVLVPKANGGFELRWHTTEKGQ
jgi:hypothetical protein